MTGARDVAFPLDPMVMATQPMVVKRACPGFLVLTAPGAPIRFGVEGATEAEALANFKDARIAWARLRAMP